MKIPTKKLLPTMALAGLISSSLCWSALAGEGDKYIEAPDPVASQAWGPGLMVRLRGLAVIPDEDGKNITANGAPIVAGIEIDNSIVPELDLTWFFTENFAAELILGVTPHDVDGTGLLQGALGDVWLLPPILLAQYHFNPGGKFKPYVGAGINYTIFFNEDDSGAFLPNAGLTVSDLDLDNSLGWALQAGVDIHLRNNMYLNFDVKKLWLETDATVRTTAGTTIRADVDIDPRLFGIGVGWKL
jgi:outer membrane protein